MYIYDIAIIYWLFYAVGDGTVSTRTPLHCQHRVVVHVYNEVGCHSRQLDITEWCIISLNHPTNSLEKAMKFLWNSMIWNSYKTWQGHPVLGSVDKWAQLILSYSIFLFILRLNSNCMKHYHLPIVSEWIGWNKCRL